LRGKKKKKEKKESEQCVICRGVVFLRKRDEVFGGRKEKRKEKKTQLRLN